jgi:hypothetical protein
VRSITELEDQLSRPSSELVVAGVPVPDVVRSGERGTVGHARDGDASPVVHLRRERAWAVERGRAAGEGC